MTSKNRLVILCLSVLFAACAMPISPLDQDSGVSPMVDAATTTPDSSMQFDAWVPTDAFVSTDSVATDNGILDTVNDAIETDFTSYDFQINDWSTCDGIVGDTGLLGDAAWFDFLSSD